MKIKLNDKDLLSNYKVGETINRRAVIVENNNISFDSNHCYTIGQQILIICISDFVGKERRYKTISNDGLQQKIFKYEFRLID